MTEGEGLDPKREQGSDRGKKGRDDIGACVSSLICAARERSDAAGEDEKTQKLTG